MTDCCCRTIFPEKGSNCNLCKRILPGSFDSLGILNEKLINEINTNELLRSEKEALELQMVKLTKKLEECDQKLTICKRDNEALCVKFSQLLERNAKLQKENENINMELQELTEKLFLEANSMVSVEARRRHEAEVQKRKLEEQLSSTQNLLQCETEQLRELKEKVVLLQSSEPEASLAKETMQALTQRDVDPRMYIEFEDFLQHADQVKMNKIHQLPFMKRVIDEDIEPCMKYVGWLVLRRFLDAWRDNNCFVERVGAEMVSISEVVNNRQDLSPETANINNGKSHPITPLSPITPTATLASASSTSSASTSNTTTNGTGFFGTLARVKSPAALEERCALCERKRHCEYRFRLDPEDSWQFIDDFCRDRIIAIADFYVYMRNIKSKLVARTSAIDLYLETCRYRQRIFQARAGVLTPLSTTTVTYKRHQRQTSGGGTTDMQTLIRASPVSASPRSPREV